MIVLAMQVAIMAACSNTCSNGQSYGPVFCCGRCGATRPTNCNFADICNRFLDLGLLLIIIIKLTGASTKMITGA